jgi:type VI secretion system protein ImpK
MIAAAGQASLFAAGESFLLVRFREFYGEVVRWKRRVVQENHGLAGIAPEASATMAATSTPPVTVVESLLGLLNRQEAEIRRAGGDYAAEMYRRAQYVMAALADETFLYLDWPGRDAWRSDLLEYRLFRSYRAGEEVFRQLGAILRTRDPVDVDLAKVLLLALGLGFRGQLRGPAGEAQIAAFRRQLYTFITHRDAGSPHPAHTLFPEAYASTIEAAGESRRLSRTRPWIVAGLLLLFAWLVAQDYVWRDVVKDLRKPIEVINKTP